MRSILLLLALLAGCDETVDWFVKGEADYGTVYVCDSGAMCVGGTEEWCWAGSEAALEDLLGAECHKIGVTERTYPAIVGCAYDCEGKLKGPGSNAHCGSFCPTD